MDYVTHFLLGFVASNKGDLRPNIVQTTCDRKMGMCARCSSAIQQLHSQWPSQHPRDVIVDLPLFGHVGVCSCWVCFKFSRWMKAEMPILFRKWRRQSIRIKFAVFCQGLLEKTQQDPLLPFSITLLPMGRGEEEIGCEIELNFISESGTMLMGPNPLDEAR